MRRSVERVKGVKKVKVLLARGIVNVTFDGQTRPTVEQLWNAIYDAGFTPVSIKMRGPAPPPAPNEQ